MMRGFYIRRKGAISHFLHADEVLARLAKDVSENVSIVDTSHTPG